MDIERMQGELPRIGLTASEAKILGSPHAVPDSVDFRMARNLREARRWFRDRNQNAGIDDDRSSDRVWVTGNLAMIKYLLVGYQTYIDHRGGPVGRILQAEPPFPPESLEFRLADVRRDIAQRAIDQLKGMLAEIEGDEGPR